jgi:1-acyl-sn-glycerol-3-phosphate acyltransferase
VHDESRAMGRDAPVPPHVRWLRYLRLVIQLMLGVMTVAFLFPFYSKARRWRAVQTWSHGVTRCAGVVVRLDGAVPDPRFRVIGVANHVSWLDIAVLHSLWHVRFVAKSEVRRWPVVGWLSARTGTLFVERGKHRHAARINNAIHQAFVEGDAVAIFPEGTTTCGDELLRFHSSLLQPAVDERAWVVPVALRYTDADDQLQPAVAYVGEMSLMESLTKIVSLPRVVAHVQFLDPIDSAGRTRRELAQLSHASIAAALRLPPAGN